MGPRRYRAPADDGAVLADPPLDRWPDLVRGNRRALAAAGGTVGGLPLNELRELARREVLAAAREYLTEQGEPSPPTVVGGLSGDQPLVLSGHQPELSHPGVWVKHFALAGLARQIRGVPLNLVADHDTVKSTALRLPTWDDRDPATVHLRSVPFDAFEGETPYEDRGVHDPELFRTFADRAAPLWRNWGYEPLLPRVWRDVLGRPDAARIGERFASARRAWERGWGCHNLELPVSRLARTDAFGRFAGHILADLPRFRAAYNAAVGAYRSANRVRSKNHPAPDLVADGDWLEAPFWVWRYQPGKRHRLMARLRPEAMGLDLLLDPAGPPTGLADPADRPEAWLRGWRALAEMGHRVRPRALTLTLFARLCLGDVFVHGIGGGKYDEVTDALLRTYFGVAPPRYTVLSATLHLPVPTFPHTAADARALAARERDLYWNPQRHTEAAEELRREKARLAAAEPADRAGRREWFGALRAVTDRLRPFVGDQLAAVEGELGRVRQEADANADLLRRDFAWVLYPEDRLRSFLKRFLGTV